MGNRVTNEGRSFHGSNVYLTSMEKEALLRAIDQYTSAVEYASDRNFIEFFQKYDEFNLMNAEKKLRNKRNIGE